MAISLTTLDYISIFLYILALGVYSYYLRKTTSFGHFAVANRSVGFLAVALSLTATFIGPGYSLGMVGKSYGSGYFIPLLALLFAGHLILFGLIFAHRFQEMKLHSLGELFEKKYGKLSQRLSGIISIIVTIGFCAIMSKMGGILLSSFTGWPLWLSVVIMTGIVIIYSTFGGLFASIHTDIAQFLIFFIMIPTVLIFALSSANTSFSELITPVISAGNNVAQSLGFWAILGIGLSFLLGELFLPPYMSRVYASKSKEIATKSFVVAGLLGIVFLAMFVLTGAAAVKILPAGTAEDGAYLSLANSILPHGLLGLFLIAILAIIMSTHDSLLNSGAAISAADIIPFKKEISKLRAGQIATLVIGIFGAFVAFTLPDVVSSLILIYGLWAPIMVVPTMFALFSKSKMNDGAGIFAMILGGLSAWLWTTYSGTPVPGVLIGLAIAILILVFGKKKT